jgi:hypothetical protein
LAAPPQLSCRSCRKRRSAKLRERFGLLAALTGRFEYLRDFHRKIRRTEGAGKKNAFLFLEDQTKNISLQG